MFAIFVELQLTNNPGRITEVLSMAVTNNASASRAIFLIDECLGFVPGWTKTRHITGARRFLMRFLHPESSARLLFVLRYLRPLYLHYCKKLAGSQETVDKMDPSLLFKKRGLLYTEPDMHAFYDRLNSHYTKLFGVDITTRQVRQLYVAIYRSVLNIDVQALENIPTGDDDESDDMAGLGEDYSGGTASNVMGAEQRGHSVETQDHQYGLVGNLDLPMAPIYKILHFRGVTERLQQWGGVLESTMEDQVNLGVCCICLYFSNKYPSNPFFSMALFHLCLCLPTITHARYRMTMGIKTSRLLHGRMESGAMAVMGAGFQVLQVLRWYAPSLTLCSGGSISSRPPSFRPSNNSPRVCAVFSHPPKKTLWSSLMMLSLPSVNFTTTTRFNSKVTANFLLFNSSLPINKTSS